MIIHTMKVIFLIQNILLQFTHMHIYNSLMLTFKFRIGIIHGNNKGVVLSMQAMQKRRFEPISKCLQKLSKEI